MRKVLSIVSLVLFLVAAMLVMLKLLRVIEISWILVLAPIWGQVLVVSIIIVIAIALAGKDNP